MRIVEIQSNDENDQFWLGLALSVKEWSRQNWIDSVLNLSNEEIAEELKSNWISDLADAIAYYEAK